VPELVEWPEPGVAAPAIDFSLLMDEPGPAPAEQWSQAQILQLLKVADREALQLATTSVLAGSSRPLLLRTVGG